MRIPKNIPKSWLRPPRGFKPPKVEDFRADMKQLGEEIAEDFKETVKSNIETNRFGYTLDYSTIQRKGSDTPLVDSGQMLDAIYRDGTTVSVEDTPRDDSSLTNLELAIVQEYGTKDKHIPARPVWRETFKEFRSPAHKRIEDFFKNPKFKGNANNDKTSK